jgi:hypothetical protein
MYQRICEHWSSLFASKIYIYIIVYCILHGVDRRYIPLCILDRSYQNAPYLRTYVDSIYTNLSINHPVQIAYKPDLAYVLKAGFQIVLDIHIRMILNFQRGQTFVELAPITISLAYNRSPLFCASTTNRVVESHLPHSSTSLDSRVLCRYIRLI